jgi:hypothetical protein
VCLREQAIAALVICVPRRQAAAENAHNGAESSRATTWIVAVSARVMRAGRPFPSVGSLALLQIQKLHNDAEVFIP